MAKLSAEEKALLAKLLEAEDDDTEDEDEEEAPAADEFTYQGKRYVYTPEDVEEVQEEAKAPRKRKAAAKAEPEEVPEEEAPVAPMKRRFLT